MEYLANLPVSDKNNFKNVECNFSKAFPLKQVYPKDKNQTSIFIKHDNEDPIMRHLVKQRDKIDNPKNKGKKTIIDYIHHKKDIPEASNSRNINNSSRQSNLDIPSSSNATSSNSRKRKSFVKKENEPQRRRKK
ncbi:hypothetical protein BCR32DRAFT_291005 [Anaeromyces robustus]|uniref:Uncharacterized protein n=1 Tax=Anaeromyces robustus TaxID=1754192 RepID=A0A1Y1XHU4_9FUNG|nr:hypothetical protein BCR32DRAFT_291005 [Anaeromyces robustus]|eukprot:ORX84946.1 hypothetical protein BCR32DRAFT_291005 [Anaeromyces robustus]